MKFTKWMSLRHEKIKKNKYNGFAIYLTDQLSFLVHIGIYNMFIPNLVNDKTKHVSLIFQIFSLFDFIIKFSNNVAISSAGTDLIHFSSCPSNLWSFQFTLSEKLFYVFFLFLKCFLRREKKKKKKKLVFAYLSSLIEKSMTQMMTME